VSFPREKVTTLLRRKDIRWLDVLLIAEVGSTAHGISVPETGDDLDLTVIRMEPFEELITGPVSRQSMMIRTQPEGMRSRMGDIDLNVYTLRKFVSLARSGNPSILGVLFSPTLYLERTPLNLAARTQLGKYIASKKAGTAYLGYMNQQIERWQGKLGQKSVSRPELVEKYGFDTKYAAHVIRLGYQGIQYMREGRLTLPMDLNLAQEIVALRTGHFSEGEASQWALSVKADLEMAIENSPLPLMASPGVDRWVSAVYRKWFAG
jgi:predicted nucleotidyltransferase